MGDPMIDRHRVWARHGWEPVHDEAEPGIDTRVDRLTVPGGWLVRYRRLRGGVPMETVVFVPEPPER